MSCPLRASDLVPGRIYLSPSGRLCRLLPLGQMGIGSTCYSFAYLSRAGDEFSINVNNVKAIAAMREAPAPSPEYAMRFGVAA